MKKPEKKRIVFGNRCLYLVARVSICIVVRHEAQVITSVPAQSLPIPSYFLVRLQQATQSDSNSLNCTNGGPPLEGRSHQLLPTR